MAAVHTYTLHTCALPRRTRVHQTKTHSYQIEQSQGIDKGIMKTSDKAKQQCQSKKQDRGSEMPKNRRHEQ